MNKNVIIRKMYIGVYAISMVMLLIAMIISAFGEELFADYNTAFYWFCEALKTGSTVFNIGLMTFLILMFVD